MNRMTLPLAFLLFASSAAAQSTTTPAPARPDVPHAPIDLTADDARQLFMSDSWRAMDPSMAEADDVDVRVRRFGGTRLVRGVPVVDGVRVEGADRLATFTNGRLVRWRKGTPLDVKTGFSLSAHEATLLAATSVPGSLFRDPTVERVSGFAHKVWLAHDDGLYAAFRVRVPTLSLRDLSDVYIDASTGKVLRRVPVARFADGGVDDDGGYDDAGANGEDAGEIVADSGPAEVDSGPEPVVDAGPRPAAPTSARLFQFAPASGGVDDGDLVDVQLSGLRPAFEGEYLRGDFVETYNCCKKYVCIDGSADCLPEARRCARDDDEEPITSDLFLEIPTENLPLPAGVDLGEVLYARTVFCAELPRVQSGADGWVEAPVDVERATNDLGGLASEEDAFAEVQAYYSTMQFFEHVRGVLEDATWCLGGKSMQCDGAGAPVLGDDGEPLRPYHVATNLLIPELDANALLSQLLSGRGTDPGNPIIVDDYQRMDNAAFVPALSGSPIEVPPEFEELVAVFNRDFDSNLYFQGKRDFAYDGDIVFHEFTHAIVHSFVPELGSLWHDEQGSHAEPGAMNEGWSDYFSSSFTGNSATGEYGGAGITGGELGLRDADNDKRCPTDLIGQVHEDSQPWSGALWDIREAVIASEGESAVGTLDQALLLALAESESNETFAAQADRVLDVIESTFDASLRADAEAAFDAHGIRSCERVWPLSVLDESGAATITPKDIMFVNAPAEVGVGNAAPSVHQLRVELPRGATSFALQWQQSNGGAAQFTGGGDPTVMQVLAVESDEPVRWTYEGVEQNAKAVFADGSEVGFDPFDPRTNSIVGTANNNGISNGIYTVTLESDPCATRSYFVQLVNRGESVRMSNITVAIETADEACPTDGPADGGTDPTAPEDCQCSSSHGDTRPALFGVLSLFGLAALMGRRRRR